MRNTTVALSVNAAFMQQVISEKQTPQVVETTTYAERAARANAQTIYNRYRKLGQDHETALHNVKIDCKGM